MSHAEPRSTAVGWPASLLHSRAKISRTFTAQVEVRRWRRGAMVVWPIEGNGRFVPALEVEFCHWEVLGCDWLQASAFHTANIGRYEADRHDGQRRDSR